MGYVNHVKQTPDELRYRVWSTFTDSYISGEMTEAELREFELVRQTRRAVENIWRSIDRDIATARRVQNWEHEEPQGSMSDEALERLHEDLRRSIGAEVDVELQTLTDGTQVITVRIAPVPKK